jgi:hypothetical protein
MKPRLRQGIWLAVALIASAARERELREKAERYAEELAALRAPWRSCRRSHAAYTRPSSPKVD